MLKSIQDSFAFSLNESEMRRVKNLIKEAALNVVKLTTRNTSICGIDEGHVVLPCL